MDKQIHNNQHDVRIGYAQISTAQTQKKQAAGARFWKLEDADAKMHLEWYRVHSKEGGGSQEQDKKAQSMLTRFGCVAEAQDHNDPQLQRPQPPAKAA